MFRFFLSIFIITCSSKLTKLRRQSVLLHAPIRKVGVMKTSLWTGAGWKSLTPTQRAKKELTESICEVAKGEMVWDLD